jgi:hypothetical protein
MSSTGIQNPDVVDLVTHDVKKDEFVVIMIETRPWDASETRLLELQRKVNNYLTFILDGQMARLYPASDGKPVRMQLDCGQTPDPETTRFIEAVRQQINRYEIQFAVNVLT